MADRVGRPDYFGRYLGVLILQVLSDGRLMRVVEPFGFEDPDGAHWPVPVGTTVDGASIPQILWSILGGPYEGKYRDASVIHDYYCDVRTQPWEAVHKVFYFAMRASGVSAQRAKLMYAGVRFAGPKWGEATRINTNLPHVHFSIAHTPFALGVLDATSVEGQSAHDFLKSGRVSYPEGDATTLDLDRVDALIESQNPSLKEIDLALDEAVRVLEWPGDERTHTLVAQRLVG